MKKKIKIGICFLAMAVVLLLLLNGEAEAAAGHTILPTCNGKIGECGAEEEFAMDSDIHRRILQDQNSFGYGGLIPGRAFCHAKSYGICIPDASNPHSHGCYAKDRCRQGCSLYNGRCNYGST